MPKKAKRSVVSARQDTGFDAKNRDPICAGDILRYCKWGFYGKSYGSDDNYWVDSSAKEFLTTLEGYVFWNRELGQWWFKYNWMEDPHYKNNTKDGKGYASMPLCDVNGIVEECPKNLPILFL